LFIKSLTLNNYTSFGNNVDIEFDDSKSILTLGHTDSSGCDSNGSGKTNFSSAIFWCLLGVPLFDDFLSNDIIRDGEELCNVTAILIDGKNELKISRTRSLSDSNSLEFYLNGILQNEKINVPSEVQKDINKYFGFTGTQKQIVTDILSTNFLSYNSVDMFVSKRFSSQDRFDFISRLFDLNKWIQCKDLAKSKSNEISSLLANLYGKQSVYESLTSNINIEDYDNENLGMNQTILENEEQIFKYSSIESKVKELSEKTDSLNNELTKLFNDSCDFTLKYNTEILKSKNELENLNEKLNEKQIGSNESIEELERILCKIKEEIAELESNYNGLAINRALLYSSLEEKEKMDKSSLQCPVCNSNLHYLNHQLYPYDKEILLSEIINIKKQISDLDKNIYEISLSKSELDKKSSEIYSTILTIKDVLFIKNKIENETNKLIEIEYEFKIKSDKNILETYKIKEDINSIEKYIMQLKEKYSNNIEKLPLLKEENKSLLEKIYTNKKIIIDYNLNLKEKNKISILIKEFEVKIANYKFWEKSFLEIRRLIIQSILPKIEELTNYFLNEMDTPFEISLDTLREYKTSQNLKEEFNIKIIDKSNKTMFPIHMHSTGERKRIGIAVCMALLELKTLNNKKILNFRFFDEVLDNLDSIGIDKFLDILNKDDNQNFIISHNDLLKSRFNKVLMINKTNGVSYVKR
jgi:DNA repair exonuclease SbcCD ATPase subunit